MTHHKHKHHKHILGVAIALALLIIILLLLRRKGISTPLDRVIGKPQSTVSNTNDRAPTDVVDPASYSTPGIPDSAAAYFGGKGDVFFRGDSTVNVDPGGGYGQYIPIFGFVGYSSAATY